MNMFLLSKAILDWLKPGDEIIVTNQDHEANIGVWRRLKDEGAIIKEWRIIIRNVVKHSDLMCLPCCSWQPKT